MDIRRASYRPAFKAKFLNSESLKQVVEYAVEHNKFDKLNNARKNIDSAFLQTRLRVDIGEKSSGKPFVTFSRFEPKKNVSIAYTMADYHMTKVSEYVCEKKQNILKFAMEKIIKLGNNAPNNNMFKNVVISKK